MADETDLIAAIKQLTDSGGSLRTKNIVIMGDQKVLKKTGVKFSLKKWFNNSNAKDFGIENGYYEVFEETTLKDGSTYHLLELAIINSNVDYIITPIQMGPVDKIRLNGLTQKLQYVEMTKGL